MFNQSTFTVTTHGQGLYSITDQVLQTLNTNSNGSGLLNIFIPHTSASLIIQENADPTAKHDLESFINQMAPEHQSWHTHTAEGPDDITAHLKSSITNTSLNIPITKGQLGLGTWQGIYLWEHRSAPHVRKLITTSILQDPDL